MSKVAERRLDAAFGALANRQRREILVSLRGGPSQTPEIASWFGFSKQAMSRHVRVLETAGLIDRVVLGRTREIRLVTEPLDTVSEWLSELRQGWLASLNRLDHVLKEYDD